MSTETLYESDVEHDEPFVTEHDQQVAETLPFTSQFAQNLRHQTAAVRLMRSRFGTRKALTADQKSTIAESFCAESDFLSASKKLIDTNDEAYKAVTQTISRAQAYWQTMTIPFPIKGIRLIRKDLLPLFNDAMQKFREELAEAVESLEAKYAMLREDAAMRLGELFNAQDYPASIQDFFHLTWDYPSVEPPNYLKELNPELYEQQAQIVQQRFESALSMAEDAFTAELQGLVSHLVDRLTDDGEDGKTKVFRNSAVENLSEFFERFKAMNIRSNGELNTLVEQAEKVISGIDPKDLRKDQSLRQHIKTEMDAVKTTLDTLVINAPERAIILED